MRIELTIDRLVLDGVGLDARHTAALREALVMELTSALAGQRSWRPRRAASVPAAPLRLVAPVRPAAVGQAIARSVHAGITAPTAGDGR
jgi:hypothetical protein